MSFQFLCPQGHLLEGDEAHSGMQCECPQCGTAFIIPTPAQVAPSQGPMAHVEIEEPAPLANSFDDVEPAPRPTAPGVERAPSLEESEGLYESELDSAVDEPLLHIPCPNGHELEVPPDMIGTRVMCPHCQAEFRLKREKSVEYLQQQEILERRRARFWFQLAIIVAGFVGVVLLAMFIMIAFS
jgi:hypothetical protein